MTARVAALVAVMLTAGCTQSLQELRSEPPSRVGSVIGDYLQLANCTVDRLQTGPTTRFFGLMKVGNLNYQTIQRQEERRATVTGMVPWATAPVLDLMFRGSSQQGVIIESRAIGGLAVKADRDEIERDTWAAIKACSGPTISISPPLE